MFGLVKILTIVSLVIAPLSAFAFDSSRKGFFVGVGGGLHNTSFDSDAMLAGQENSGSDTGLATSFKIGGGVTDQFALYYVRYAVWFKSTTADQSESFTATTGLAGIGASYFFSKSAPSTYLIGAVGFGDFAAPFEPSIDPGAGSALAIGGGYEFSSHSMLEATLLSVETEDSTDLPTSSFQSIQITYNYMWY